MIERVVHPPSTGYSPPAMVSPCWIWSVPFYPLRYGQVIDLVDQLIADGRPTYFITANLNYVMISHRIEALEGVSRRAAFVVADGITLVWASRWKGIPLPERVTGSDLIYGLCELAARRGYRVFLLGAGPSVAEEAARKLTALYPSLSIVGVESPPFRTLDVEETEVLKSRIRETRPELLFVAFGQPKGDLWIAEHFASLGLPVSVQVGAAFDFVAGRVRRAPRWVQKIHMETPFRILQEPRRLAPRYIRNALFLARMILSDLQKSLGGHGALPESLEQAITTNDPKYG